MTVHEHGHQIGDHLYLHRHTVVHEVAGHWKLVASLAFLVVVIATPVGSWTLFGWYALLLGVGFVVAKLPIRHVLPRFGFEVPFVLFAVLMPFVGQGPKTELLGLTVSEVGLQTGTTLIAKITLGTAAAILLSATTTTGDLLRSLSTLRLPNQLVQIAAFMIRYSSVVTDELRRMQVSWQARGFTATGVRSWPTVASTAAALFVRSYERGERVHLAMLSRGYSGEIDFGHAPHSRRGAVLAVFVLPLAAAAALVWRSL